MLFQTGSEDLFSTSEGQAGQLRQQALPYHASTRFALPLVKLVKDHKRIAGP
jgi:hypothetical protein